MDALLYEGVGNIFREDKERLDEVLGGQGWRYFGAAICIFPLTILKVIYFLINNQHLFREPKIMRQQKVEEMKGIGLSNSDLKLYAKNVFRANLEDYNTEVIAKSNKSSAGYTQEPKVNAVQRLQNTFNKNLRLGGIILRTTHHRLSDTALLEGAETGVIKEKYLTQRVTFGNEMNATLKTVFPSLKLRNLKGSTDTYFIFENDGVFELERKLRETFMQPVTITLEKKLNEE